MTTPPSIRGDAKQSELPLQLIAKNGDVVLKFKGGWVHPLGMAQALHMPSQELLAAACAEFLAASPSPVDPAGGMAGPNLWPVIQWLEGGCDPLQAAKELRIYAAAIKQGNGGARD